MSHCHNYEEHFTINVWQSINDEQCCGSLHLMPTTILAIVGPQHPELNSGLNPKEGEHFQKNKYFSA